VAVAGQGPDQPSPDAEWWTTTDVANYLGVRLATVGTYRMRGQMPAPDHKLGRTQLWRPRTIIQWSLRPGAVVVCAWGAHPTARDRAPEVLHLLRATGADLRGASAPPRPVIPVTRSTARYLHTVEAIQFQYS
jgi:hypothetical protein